MVRYSSRAAALIAVVISLACCVASPAGAQQKPPTPAAQSATTLAVSLPSAIEGLDPAQSQMVIDAVRGELRKLGIVSSNAAGAAKLAASGRAREHGVASGRAYSIRADWHIIGGDGVDRGRIPFNASAIDATSPTPDKIKAAVNTSAAKLAGQIAERLGHKGGQTAAAGQAAGKSTAAVAAPAAASTVASAACLNRAVPNPHPVPGETHEWYGNCSGKLTGLIVWYQHGEPNQIVCHHDGEWHDLWKAIRKPHEKCLPLFAAIPKFCKVDGKYYGQCDGGVPNGLGYQIHDGNAFATIGPYNMVPSFHRYIGSFKRGKYEGFGALVKQDCSMIGCSNVRVEQGVFSDGKLVLACKNPGECRQKREAAQAVAAQKKEDERRRPIIERRQEAIRDLRCDDARKLDADLGETTGHAACLQAVERKELSDKRTTAMRDLRCDEVKDLDGKLGDQQFATCILDTVLKSDDARTMYLAAVKYEAEKDRPKAKRIYLTIIDRFPRDDHAVKAGERLTALADVEAIEASNASSASAVSQQQKQTQDAIERARRDASQRRDDDMASCRKGLESCMWSCSGLNNGGSCRDNCRSRHSQCN